MNFVKVKRLYELKRQIKELETEEAALVKELKEEMLAGNIRETVAGSYKLLLQQQDRSTYGPSVIPYLKGMGHPGLVVETYDHDRLKELRRRGLLDESELERHKLEKITYNLYVRPC